MRHARAVPFFPCPPSLAPGFEPAQSMARELPLGMADQLINGEHQKHCPHKMNPIRGPGRYDQRRRENASADAKSDRSFRQQIRRDHAPCDCCYPAGQSRRYFGLSRMCIYALHVRDLCLDFGTLCFAKPRLIEAASDVSLSLLGLWHHEQHGARLASSSLPPFDRATI